MADEAPELTNDEIAAKLLGDMAVDTDATPVEEIVKVEPTAEELAKADADEEAAKEVIADEVVAAEAVAAVTEGKAPNRINAKHLPEAQRKQLMLAVNLAASEGIDVDVALARIKGTLPDVAAQAAQHEAARVAAEKAADPIAAKRDELKALSDALDEELELQPLSSKELQARIDQRTDLRREIADFEKEQARSTAQQESSAETAFTTEFNAHRDAAFGEFPDAAKADTALGKYVEAIMSREADKGEDSKFCGNTQAYKLIVEEAARDLNIKSKTELAATIQQTTPTQAAKPAMRPLPSQGTTPHTGTPQAADKAAYVERLAKATTDDERAAIINESIGVSQGDESPFGLRR